MRRAAITAAAAVAVLAGAGSAQAGPPGKWTQVTGIGQDDLNIMRVSVARGNDGVLHVLWTRDDTVLHSTVSANAKTVSGPATLFASPSGVNESVDIVRAPDGTLRAFFAASNTFGDGMASAVSPDGKTWTVQGLVSRPDRTPVYAAEGIGAAVRSDGTFFSIWGDSAPGTAGYHVGLDTDDPNIKLPGGMKVDPDVGVDAGTGQAYGAWNSLDDEGVVVMPLAPGATRRSIPNSATDLQRPVGITGRLGAPGVFAAYHQGDNVFLAKPAVYRVDTGKTQRLSRKDGELVSIAPAPEGRLWVFWEDGGTIHATRSNKAATRWSSFIKVKAPRRATTLFHLAGEGSLGPLDLLAHVDPPTGTLASWHQRLLPRLSLKVKQRKGRTIVAVTDVGDPVSGAKVKVPGHGTKTTGSRGTAAFNLPEGTYRVTVTKEGYARARKGVRAR